MKELLLELAREKDSGQTKEKIEEIVTSALASGEHLSADQLIESPSVTPEAQPAFTVAETAELPDVSAAVFTPPTKAELEGLAAAAVAAGRAVFSFPPEPVPVSGPLYIYYNKNVGWGLTQVLHKCFMSNYY